MGATVGMVENVARAAGIVVGKLGTAVVTRQELTAAFQSI